jgi:hypothetical protein
MSRNAVGIVLRIFGIFSLLIFLWVFGIFIVYLVICYIFNITPTLFGYLLSFCVTILFRMFYPKNVFV